MALYRKKPVVVEAVQWTMEGEHDHRGVCADYSGAFVETIHGQRAYLASGDWIITEPDGIHFYPCKPDIFAATYEPAETERLSDVEAPLQPCGYCEKHVEAPCTDGSQAQACYRQPPDVAAMPPGARADAMRHGPDWRAQAAEPYIENVYYFQNGMVSVTDQNGQQMPEYQGRYDDVWPKIQPALRVDSKVHDFRRWGQQHQPIGLAGLITEDDYRHPNQRATRFRDEIEQVINSHSRENGSGTPDFVLAQFVLDVMDAFDCAVTRRQSWYGRPTDEKALIKMLNERLQADQAEIERLNAAVRLRDDQITQLRGELQRASTPSRVIDQAETERLNDAASANLEAHTRS